MLNELRITLCRRVPGSGQGARGCRGYDRHDLVGAGSGNSRNGSRSKIVLTDVGPVEVDVPRDRTASFEPVIVKKRQRRLSGVEDLVLSLSAKVLTTGETSARLAEVYDAQLNPSCNASTPT